MEFNTDIKIFSREWFKVYFKPATIHNNSFWIFIIFFVITSVLIFFLKNRVVEEFWNGVLVEATGFLFDIFLFGILFTVYDSISNKKRLIEKYRNEIDFFRTWNSKESSHRISGNLRLLNKQNISKLNLEICRMSELNLIGVNLSGSYFHHTEFDYINFAWSDFSSSEIIFSEFDNCTFNNVNFQGIVIEKSCSYFRNCYLADSNFKNSNLAGVSFKNCILSGADLSNSNIHGTLFSNCIVETEDWINELKIDEKYHSKLNNEYLIEEYKEDEHSMIQSIREDYGKFWIRHKEFKKTKMVFNFMPFRNNETTGYFIGGS